MERCCNVFVESLDICTHFDSVWIVGLLYQLFEIEMNGKLCMLIKEMYTGP